MKRKYLVIKRFFDIILSFISIIVLLPLLVLLYLIIFFDNPKGSPIFKQIRCGLDGKEFYLYKFRTMYIDAENQLGNLLELNEMSGPAFKIKNDPRITRFGKILRKTGLDELPQLINIFKGEMSIVGPRPPLPREVVLYTDYQKQRLSVTPGLTCYWQIQPNRNEISFDEWLDLDIKYIKERSLYIDLCIILKTFRTVVEGDGI